MVAYSFKRRFVAPIRVGLGIVDTPDILPKMQTIRALGKRRHAQPGDMLQLYHGMRSQHCFLIGLAICNKVLPVRLWIGGDDLTATLDGDRLTSGDADEFAQRDGFSGLPDMHQFWREEHPDVVEFTGLCIMWKGSS